MVDMPGGAPIARVRAGSLSALVAILALPALMLVGCGSGEDVASKSASEILAASRAAATSATSLHMVSNLAQRKLKFASDQQAATNSGQARISALGVAYEVIRTDNTAYIKGSPAFYKRLRVGTGRRIPKDAWLKMPASAGGVTSGATLTQLHIEVERLLTSNGKVTKGPTTTIDGQKAIELHDTGKLFTGTIYIAATGTPYPIQIVKHGRETGRITFDGWNDPVTLSAPAGAVELSQLEYEGGH